MTAGTLLGPDHQAGRNLMRTAVRLLSHGSPITVTELAEAAGIDAADLANAPAGEDIEYDDERRIVGWGLTLNPTPHAFVVDGHRLYTWCAADTLMFPTILGGRAHVESTCPATGVVIRLTVDPAAGVSDVSPATAVNLDPCRAGLGRLSSACHLLQSRSVFRDRSGRGLELAPWPSRSPRRDAVLAPVDATC